MGGPVLVGLAGVAVTLVAGRTLSLPAAVAVAVVVAVLIAATAVAEALRGLIVRMRRTPLRSHGLDVAGFAAPRPAPHVLLRPRGGVVVEALLAIPSVAVLGWLLLRDHRSGLRQRAVDAISAAVGRFEPQLLLYFAGNVDELYQLRMWFEPVQRLGLRALVVVRSDLVMDRLDDAPIPVICSPYNGVIAALPLPNRIVTLFVTHSGNNLTMLRRPETVCVFVGHGDSDKPDSSNPYARVYDEVWVAGPLGRRRYREAGVGVRNEAIREVGRPQFVPPAGALPSPPVIVYAPTWEGWGDDPHHTSLPHVGVALIDALLATPGVTVRYRPHPLTGRRDVAVRRAHEAILKRAGRVSPDEPLERTMAGAAAMVLDVSSVIGEYLAYDRPYAVADTRGLGRRACSREFPSTAGGFLLGPDLSGLDAFVSAASGGRDATRAKRRALLADALGDPGASQDRFAAEVRRLLRGSD
ncbi:MAG TPA: CDP-glycerol glycerophosphotransferase family protein [Mycobacteriales bacterium]|nr:CDP-glycerol glycerophosphotransferase family protein [Mycobacteriales bacterium]